MFDIDVPSRTVTGKIVFEEPDGFSYILGYCPEAFAYWNGYVYEMFDQMIAPSGKLIKVIPHPEEYAVTIVSKVSPKAQSTWQKLLDKTLTKYSFSLFSDQEFGNDPQRWPKKDYEGQKYPYLPRYTIAGVSYVDEPPATYKAISNVIPQIILACEEYQRLTKIEEAARKAYAHLSWLDGSGVLTREEEPMMETLKEALEAEER